MHTHSEMRAYALEFLLTSDEGLCPGALLTSDEGLCPGSIFMLKATRAYALDLVPHAFKMLGLHSQVKLSSRVV